MNRTFHWLIVSVVSACAGCTSYEPQPLGLSEHAEAWERRGLADLDEQTVERFYADLRRRPAARDAASPAEFDVRDGVTLAEAEALALALNRDLRVARSRAAEATAGAEQAGRWDDPHLEADLVRVVESVPHPWLGGFGIGFTIPLSGRLEAAEALAWARSHASWGAVAEDEHALLVAVGRSWRDLAAARQRRALLDDYIQRVTLLAGRADQLANAGELSPVNARVLRMDIAERSLMADETSAEIARLETQLRSRLGLAPSADVTFIAESFRGATEDHVDSTRELLLDHPRMITARARYEAAEQSLRREVRKQYPDLTIGPVYENEEGQSRIGLTAGIPVPLLNRNRRGIAEAAARRDTARVEAEAAYEALASDVAEHQRRRDAAQHRLTRLRHDIAPLVDEQLGDIARLIELGEANILIIHDALERSINVKLAVLDAAVDAAHAEAAVHAALTPRWATAPPTSPTTPTQGEQP